MPHLVEPISRKYQQRRTIDIVSSHHYKYEPSEYRYSFDPHYFDPRSDTNTVWNLDCGKDNRLNDDIPPRVALNAINFCPKEGKSWEDVKTQLANLNNPRKDKARLIYVTRHGNTGHNAARELFGKAAYYAYLADHEEYLDPTLSEKGKLQAQKAGQIVAGAVANGAPFPKAFYTSSLKRCPQTALLILKSLQSLCGHTESPAFIMLSDKLREWFGINHKHTSDKRSTWAEIIAYMKDWTKEYLLRPIEVKYDCPFTDQDKEFEREELVEAHVEVEERVRVQLDAIFSGDEDCVYIVLHNRSFVAFARAIGHGQESKDEVHMENCATLAFLVEREKLCSEALKTRKQADERRKQEELMRLNQEKNDLCAQAAGVVASLPEDAYRQLKEKVGDAGGDVVQLERAREGYL